MKLKRLLSPMLLLSAAMLWGFAFAAQDKASSIGAFSLGAARSFLASVFLIFVIIILDRVLNSGRRLISRRGVDFNKYELIGGAVCGTILAVASALQQLGINAGTDGGKAAFITAIYVVLVPIYALPIGKKATVNVWISVVIAVLGFYLLCIKDDLTILPADLLVIGCALIFPLHILTIDYFSPRCDGVRMSCIQFLVAGLINLVVALITEEPIEQFHAIFNNLLPVIYLGIASSGIAYTLQIIGQRDINPAAASIILSLESVFGVIGAAIFLGTSLSVREYIGCVIVLAAVIISQIDFSKKKS